ncbi:MAG: 3-deoxy-manno-octulosonate cytidylyltransferase [Bacteroidales bacterium]|nr:3-deoxy-manno-octulosonate cytidylyltransferase [Bacteroidales bacterium]
MKEILAIIPSRYASTRLPGKPLALVGGIPMVVRTLRQAAKVFSDVCVATDDERIKETVEKWGGVAVMTSASHPSGTDRCLEAMKKYSAQTGRRFDVVVNVQGDEPFISTNQLEKLAKCFEDESVCLATIVKRATSVSELEDPNRPKVVIDKDNNALYFSRNRIPYDRSGKITDEDLVKSPYYLHVGLYGYRSRTLEKICSMKESSLEKTEKLEQLRWLENGLKIRVAESNDKSYGVDTPEDLERLNRMIESGELKTD